MRKINLKHIWFFICILLLLSLYVNLSSIVALAETNKGIIHSNESDVQIIPVEKVYVIEDFSNKVQQFTEELKTRKIQYTDLEVQSFIFAFNFGTFNKTEGLIHQIMDVYSLPKLRDMRVHAELKENWRV